ncbi:hypothetical protein [Winogradskyella undariae]|uniref:hypothetical protein n=1 Tax=Winogradskyella undariae TaxID=1285465 RepID=UPI0015C8CD4D|nr:hypothetical protein [Winogradskyella undariae]QNK76563.1 hypothetical protein H7F37_10495 [Winogradskyella sp. PAMC22761]
MKTLKITLSLVAVLLLTVSVVKTDGVEKSSDAPTYKEYSPNDLLAIDKKKLKLQTQG